jgi:flagellar hook assembly protein FlgD
VNIAGDIGHQITMTLDDNYGETRDITEFFEYDKGSYVSGRLKYNLYDLDEGDHGLQVKAWDNSNNSAIAETRFTVVTERELQIRNLLNYPNPITETTSFTFELSQDAEVSLKIYSVSGRLLRKFETHMASIGFNLFPVVWDCTDQDGDVMANGVYLYKLIARADRDGETVTEEKIGKLVIAR